VNEDEGGVYYQVRMPDGSVAHGVAPDEARAKALIEMSQEGRVYSCDNCMGAVRYDDAKRSWVHQSFDPGADPVLCYPPVPGKRAWPAAPVRRDRPYVRGLWANNAGPTARRNNICGPSE
jgi:hypothetical protein